MNNLVNCVRDVQRQQIMDFYNQIRHVTNGYSDRLIFIMQFRMRRAVNLTLEPIRSFTRQEFVKIKMRYESTWYRGKIR
jgi:hypothetical protein